ncbi:MAG TPA: galactose-1-phosphate uridylyltransferase [Bryobacteraceae bacterium]|nr:galactose-1-phosphate uridylyltransferase [Bryobacteraceae bacterium]
MPEFRKDPITGRWVIVAVDRAMRPTDFVRDHVAPVGGRFCPLCHGHEEKTPPEVLAYRPNGGPPNAGGWSLRVVPNKFPALRVEGELSRQGEGLYDKMNGIGAHELVIETPDHMLTMGELTDKQVEDVFWAVRDRIVDLRKDFRLRYIIVFKNHGDGAGALLEHGHSQIVALPVVPKRMTEEIEGAKRYYDFRERCIYCDIIRQDIDGGSRVVLDTEHFVAISPYAARFPFETWVLPKKHVSHFESIEIPEVRNLGWIQRAIIRKLDKVLEKPAYNLMIHSAPIQDSAMAHYHWHIEIIPKLTKVAGFEWGTGFYINPTPPEEAARFLREVGIV